MKLSITLSTIPTRHPLRVIRTICDEILEKLTLDLSAPPSERPPDDFSATKSLLKAQLLRAIYSIRTERQLLDQVDFNVLFRWFVGLPLDAEMWDMASFAEGSARLVAAGTTDSFFETIVRQPQVRRLLAGDLFSVDNTQIKITPTPFDERPRQDHPTGLGPVVAAADRRDHGFTAVRPFS